MRKKQLKIQWNDKVSPTLYAGDEVSDERDFRPRVAIAERNVNGGPIEGQFTFKIQGNPSIYEARDYKVTAIFTPTGRKKNNYEDTSKDEVISIAEPPIIWETPEPVEYGTPIVLGDYLNASCPSTAWIPSYRYSIPHPIENTGDSLYLPAGEHKLVVTYTRPDMDHKLTKTVTLKIYKKVPRVQWRYAAPIFTG